jgi:hypothetical protein
MPGTEVHVPVELRPRLEEARSAYRAWLESRGSSGFFHEGDEYRSATCLATAVDELLADAVSAEVELAPFKQALLSAFAVAFEDGILDIDAYSVSDAMSCARVGDSDSESTWAASPPGTVGTFHSVHPIDTVMEVMLLGVRGQLSSPEQGVAQPGVLASIYIGELTDQRLVVTARNVLESYFSFVIELTADDTGTHGRAYFDRSISGVRWFKNAIDLAAGVQSVRVSASATIAEWDIGGSK